MKIWERQVGDAGRGMDGDTDASRFDCSLSLQDLYSDLPPLSSGRSLVKHSRVCGGV